MIIKSLYTHLFCRNDNCYIYNSETNFFAVIPQELYMKVFDEDFCSLNKDIMKFLLDNKLVLEEKDKYTYFKEQKLRFGSSLSVVESVVGIDIKTYMKRESSILVHPLKILSFWKIV